MHPSLHVCTQSVHNPASMGGDQVRDGGYSSKVWDRGALGQGCREPGGGVASPAFTRTADPEEEGEPWRLADGPLHSRCRLGRVGGGGALSPPESVRSRTAGPVTWERCDASPGLPRPALRPVCTIGKQMSGSTWNTLKRPLPPILTHTPGTARG